MKTLNLGIQKMDDLEMKNQNGGQYFKPSIDGSWLANERSILLKVAMNTRKSLKSNSFFDWLFG